MFVGHYAAAFLARAAEPRVPLWQYFLAVQAVDVAWAVLVLLGVEKFRLAPGITAGSPLDLYYMPFTHSLPATFGWMFAAFLGLRAAGAARRAAAFFGFAVGSHWLLDLLVHRPDLPLYADAMKVGFGLWNYPLLSFALEATLVLGCAFACAQRAATGRARLLGFAGALLVLQAVSSFGAGPSGERAFVASALVLFLTLAAVASWAERGKRTAAGDGAAER